MITNVFNDQTVSMIIDGKKHDFPFEAIARQIDSANQGQPRRGQTARLISATRVCFLKRFLDLKETRSTGGILRRTHFEAELELL